MIFRRSLANKQRAFLQLVFDEFLRTARWPTYGYLERALFKQDQPPVQILVDRAGRDILGTELPVSPNSLCWLTMNGIALCEGADELVEDFLTLSRWCAQRYEANTGGSEIEVTTSDLQSELKISRERSLRLGAVLRHEHPPFASAKGYANDLSSYTIALLPDSMYFANVQSLDGYRDQVKYVRRLRGLEHSRYRRFLPGLRERKKWTRGEKITFAGVIIAVLLGILAFMQAEVRSLLGL